MSDDSFEALGLDARLLASLQRLGFDTPTPIQRQAVPPLLAGRDVIGRARTGSGKTAAYGLPMLQRLAEGGDVVRGLVLAPTRELALQITQALRDLATELPIRVVTIYGGAPYEPQLKALARGVPIVVGTPGRVIDHLNRGSLDLSHVEFLVLDEADEMLRMGFIEDVEAVLEACPRDRQVALLSATMPEFIQRVASGHLNEPVELQLDDDGPRVDHIDQRWLRVAQKDKLEALRRLLLTSPGGATLVFVRTRLGCAEVADELTRLGIGADALHGDLTQAARERVLHRLRAGGIDVVVATDVAARGIDVEHIGRVINLDLPDDTETYVHRIGRTARAGREGEAITLVTSSQRKRIGDIARELGVDIRKDRVPTDADIARHQHRVLQGRLHRVLMEADLDPARSWIAALAEEEGWSTAEIAAAAITRLAELDGIDLAPPPPEAEPEPEEVAVPRDVSGAHVEVFFPIGQRHGLRPGDLVGALCNEAGLTSEHIGRITILHRKSFVGLPPELAFHLMEQHPTLEIRGQLVRLNLARERQDERPPRRGPPRFKPGRRR